MMPDLPSLHAIAVMVITIIGLYLFSRDSIPIETSGLIIFITILSMFYLFPLQVNGFDSDPVSLFLNSFGNEALVTICALLAVGKAIEVNGSLRPLVSLLSKSWVKHPQISFLGVLLFGAFFSAFINNTPIVVMLIPALIAVAKEANISSTKVLMPMGMATLIGGMSTTIGTSTNLLVVGIANDMGQEQIQLFDFMAPALMAGSVGMLFLWLVAPKYLPDDKPRQSQSKTRIFEAVLYINEDSYPNGKTLLDVMDKAGKDFDVQKIKRSDSLFVAKIPSVVFEPGDRIYVKSSIEKIKEFEGLLGLTLYEEDDGVIDSGQEIGEKHTHLAEVVITAGSFLDRSTLNAQRFAQRFNLLPIAIHSGRTASQVSGDITSKRLKPGDVILVQGEEESIANLKTNANMLVIESDSPMPSGQKAYVPLYIMLGIVGCAASGLLPISVAALVGLGVMLVTKTIKWSDVGNAMNIPIIMLIVASLSLGTALEITGGSAFLAEMFVFLTQTMSIPMILSTLMLVMAVLTNIVSNNAAAVIGTPIAISIGQQLGAPIEPFVLAVLFGANMSFVTPIGYQTNLLVMGAGGYKFNDFVKVGFPLAVIMWVSLSIILPLLYSL
jgi:di/tricarboxylate transporter